MTDSSSTTSPTGASLSDILFSFVLEKYIVCDVCGLRSPSFESSSVLYISPTDTPSMQNLILEGLQQKLQKSCSRCNKNTWHIESSYILQPPKYLLLFANRFRYLNNNITKDRCTIPLDTTVRLGPLKFNLQATLDYHGPSIDSGHYTASINCCKKTFYCNDHKITEFGITDKNSSTAYIVLYKWIDTWFLDSNRRVHGSLIAPMALAHPLHPIDNRSRNKRRNLWVGLCVSSWWPWFRPEALCKYICIYIYMYFPYTSSVIGRIYNGIVIQYWRSCTPSRIGECAVPGLNAILCFLWFTNCVLLFDKNLLLGCLWHLVFV